MDKQFYTYNLNPVPASRPRVTRFGVFYGKKHTAYSKILKQLMDEDCKKGAIKHTGPVVLTLKFGVEVPKSLSKPKKQKRMQEHHIIKPDLDNLCKLAMDCASNFFYHDDAQVVGMCSKKLWVPQGQGYTKLTVQDA